MKYKSRIIIVITLLCAASFSKAQEAKHKAIPLLFFNNKFSNILFPAASFSLLNTTSAGYKLPQNVFDNQVHYTAFFCKMEVKNRERYNIWLKLHAGDYDNYSKGNDEK